MSAPVEPATAPNNPDRSGNLFTETPQPVLHPLTAVRQALLQTVELGGENSLDIGGSYSYSPLGGLLPPALFRPPLASLSFRVLPGCRSGRNTGLL